MQQVSHDEVFLPAKEVLYALRYIRELESIAVDTVSFTEDFAKLSKKLMSGGTLDEDALNELVGENDRLQLKCANVLVRHLSRGQK